LLDPLKAEERLKGTVKLTIKRSAAKTQKLEAMATLIRLILFICCQSEPYLQWEKLKLFSALARYEQRINH